MAEEEMKIVWRILDFLIAAVFIFAGAVKILNLDPLISHLGHLQFANLIGDLQHLKLVDPTGFAIDIDNYKILPWPIVVAFAFYLPWLEIFCGLSLIARKFYGGGLSILTALVGVFIAASLFAKARGIDITCGCFGHVSKNWSFSTHLAVDFALFAALLALVAGAKLHRRADPVAMI
jgi:putative oxidoreductase